MEPDTDIKVLPTVPSFPPSLFDEDDDPRCWEVALQVILGDAAALCLEASASKRLVVVEVGRCSHWLRPHQTRWTAAGGFAWPTGYDGGGYSRLGLPEFDWHVELAWEPDECRWAPFRGSRGKRPLVLRVTLPSRTARHDQAAAHVLWTPGPPTRPRAKLLQFYGFRKQEDAWRFVAHHVLGKDQADDDAGLGQSS